MLKAEPRPCDLFSKENYRDGSGVFPSIVKEWPTLSNLPPSSASPGPPTSVNNSPFSIAPTSWQFFEHHFSIPRLNHYMAARGNDPTRAVQLYQWNAEISAAYWKSLSYFEVALRNAIDREMNVIHAAKGRGGHWIWDDACELGRDATGLGQHKYPYVDIATATRRVRKNNMPVSPGQVISELPFGFWHQMVSKSQLFLWPDLVRAFPNSPDRRLDTVHDPIARIRDFRYRIGHHHRIWSTNILDRYNDMILVAGYLDANLPTWIDARSRVPALLQSEPG